MQSISSRGTHPITAGPTAWKRQESFARVQGGAGHVSGALVDSAAAVLNVQQEAVPVEHETHICGTAHTRS